MTIRIAGEVFTGKGVGASFTQLDWALKIFEQEFQIDPFPGTLNLRVRPTSLAAWRELASQGRTFPAPTPESCDTKCYAVRIEHGHTKATGIIVLPLVDDYDEDQIEIVAEVNLRAHFALGDGDLVTLHIQT